MKIQSFVDHYVAETTLQQPEAYLATMPQVGPTPVEVVPTTLSHPYKPLGLWARP